MRSPSNLLGSSGYVRFPGIRGSQTPPSARAPTPWEVWAGRDTPQTSGLSHEQPDRTKRFPTLGIGALVGVGLLVIAMLAIIIGLIAMVF